MKKELQVQLKNKHPQIFEMLYVDDEPDEEAKERIKNGGGLPIENFGITCYDGWYTLIDELCETIEGICDEKEDIPQVHQIKEKFGGLRFYLGGIKEEYSKEIYGAKRLAEKMSYKICEKCGTTDDVIVDKGGYIRTLCKECRENKKEEDKYE